MLAFLAVCQKNSCKRGKDTAAAKWGFLTGYQQTMPDGNRIVGEINNLETPPHPDKISILNHFQEKLMDPIAIVVLVAFLILVAAAAIIPGQQRKRTEKEGHTETETEA